MNLPGLKEHGSKNKPCNLKMNKKEHFKEIEQSVHTYFEDLKGQAETHATETVHEAAGVELREEEVDVVELPLS